MIRFYCPQGQRDKFERLYHQHFHREAKSLQNKNQENIINSRSSQTEKDFLDIKKMVDELNYTIPKSKTTYYENIGKISNDKLQLKAHQYILKSFFKDKMFLQLHLFWLEKAQVSFINFPVNSSKR